MPEVRRMVGKYDRLTNELQRTCVKLNDELIFSPQKYGAEDYFHIEIPSASKFYRIGYSEYVFVSLLDGQTNLAAALAITSQTLGPTALNEDQAKQIIHWLLENGMANLAGAEVAVDPEELAQQKVAWHQKLNPFWMKLPLGNPNDHLDQLLTYCKWMLHPWFVVVSVLFIIAGMTTAWHSWDEFSASFDVTEQNNWLWMLAGWVVLKIIHEAAHGVTCRHFNGQVKETGIIFILLAPMAYVDVTSSWRFQSRWHRIGVACAGMYVELIIAAACVFAWSWTSSEVIRMHLFNLFFMASVSTILFNANPLMRFDGYFVLSDLLKIPNLYTNGTKAFQNQMQWLFYGQRDNSQCHEIENNRSVVTTYGWLAAIWKVLICVGLSITASVMFGGFGILLAMFGVVSWFGKPVWGIAKNLLQRRNSRPHTVVRAATVATAIATIGLMSWFYIPNPFSNRAPCVVAFEDASEIRSETAGFISEVFIDDGDEVSEGTVLIQLSNRELETQVRELEAKLKKEETAERIAMDKREPAEAQVAAKNQIAILEKLAERKSDLAALTVRAPVTGRVVARNLRQMPGQFVEPGDLLMTIGGDSQKEIQVSVAAEDVDSTDALLGRKISVEIGSCRSVAATIKRVTPRASSRVSHQSLIAPNGGPIPVKGNTETNANDETPYEFCEARFHVVAELSDETAAQFFAGENGYAKLDSNSETLGKYFVNSLNRWVRDQLAMVAP